MNKSLPKGIISQKGVALTSIAVIIGVFIFCFFYIKRQFDFPFPVIGQKLPHIIVQRLDGKNIIIDSLLEKNSVVMFFLTDCSHCKSEIADILPLYPILKDSINIIGVSFSNIDQTINFVIKTGIDFPVFIDVNREAKNSFRAYATPSIYFFNTQKRLVIYKFGEQRGKELRAMLLSFANITLDSTQFQL